MNKMVILVLLIISPWAASASSLTCNISSGGQLVIDFDTFNVEIHNNLSIRLNNYAPHSGIRSLFSSNTLCGKTFSPEKYGIVPAYNLQEEQVVMTNDKIYFSAIAIADAKANRNEVHYFPWSLQYDRIRGFGLLTCQGRELKRISKPKWVKIAIQDCISQ
jgi:hypothetical protein